MFKGGEEKDNLAARCAPPQPLGWCGRDHEEKGANTTTELWPPKPKLLEMPAVMLCCCFSLGTTFRPATSSMGFSWRAETQREGKQ